MQRIVVLVVDTFWRYFLIYIYIQRYVYKKIYIRSKVVGTSKKLRRELYI